MAYYLVKIVLSALLLVSVAEVAQRHSLIGGILASVPLTSLLAIIWLYIDTQDLVKVTALAHSIFWMVIPSLVFFLTLPMLLKTRLNFYLALVIASLVTIVAYFLMILILKKLGIVAL